MSQADLFGDRQELPNGLLYRPEFLSPEEEAELITHIIRLPFREARFRQYTARRRVVRFGEGDYLESEPDQETDFPRIEFPPFLREVRSRVAAWLGKSDDDFVHGLVTEYAPGTPIGWHRDAPHFEIVAGISLAGTCRMRYRTFADKDTIFGLELKPRSLYVMQDDIRWKWEHSIPPVTATRYSITLRTLAAKGGDRRARSSS